MHDFVPIAVKASGSFAEGTITFLHAPNCITFGITIKGPFGVPQIVSTNKCVHTKLNLLHVDPF